MIIKMNSYGDCGWMFTVSDGVTKNDYRTDGNGKGLWHLIAVENRPGNPGEFDEQWQLIRTTIEFQLPLNGASAYAKIRRIINGEFMGMRGQ
jgi:hypothetical protein